MRNETVKCETMRYDITSYEIMRHKVMRYSRVLLTHVHFGQNIKICKKN